ncbi:helix-turn-helix domain-containing protein [Chitinophaga nivalis]|uniref:AraC family transcriptional regulator n=1 Tax=Chitinophaga nivalis TaxID=2991709 RepID=A0ABT3IS99_9BACT|nr:AraC family transcriptional regulator [Chitinophaga nivalis]MCW3463452.1 AraC family transcriptional regulator [Chitinophaga nivalis]MCW3486858.1 AraC family transcriptional regulator [Chitinophaga nivalis]
MAREHLYHPFEIDFTVLSSFPRLNYRNHFFKLIYIMEGSGTQYMNNHRFSYQSGNLFLVTPADSYTFSIDTTTTFFGLSFHDTYLHAGENQQQDWAEHIQPILRNASHRPGCILKNQVDKPMVATLVNCLHKEYTNEQIYHHKIIQQFVNTLILVVARNIALKLPKNIKEHTGEVILDILHYIQTHIFDPQLLKAAIISREVGISTNYLGRYFKKQTGDTLQQYISHYKLRLIEMRLLHSDMRINEIACELNFTDESHLNRIFKKHKGISPSAYRKKYV